MNLSVNKIKRQIFDIIDDRDESGKPNNLFDYFIITLILINVISIFLLTIPYISEKYGEYFNLIEFFTIIVFMIEYFLRIWTCTYYEKYSHPVVGRIRFALSLNLIIDLLAFFPFLLMMVVPIDKNLVKFLSMFRMFRLFKLFRYYNSTGIITNILKKNKEFFTIIFTGFGIILVFSSYFAYIFESAAQPEVFSDLPSAFWWSIITLTTVGYGDIYPITLPGKFLTFMILIIGIVVFTLPAGIITSGFMEEIRNQKKISLADNRSIVEKIEILKIFYEEGTLSEQEFTEAKKILLKEESKTNDYKK